MRRPHASTDPARSGTPSLRRRTHTDPATPHRPCIRATTDAASSSAATRAPAARGLLDPQPADHRPHPGIHHGAVRQRQRCRAAPRHRTRSEISPARSAPIVAGISCADARDNPTNRSPKLGDSRRANATADPTDRPHPAAPPPPANTATHPSPAPAPPTTQPSPAPFRRPDSSRSRSDNEPTSTPANHARNAATVDTAVGTVHIPEAVDGLHARAPPPRHSTCRRCERAAAGDRSASEIRPGTPQPGSTTRPTNAPVIHALIVRMSTDIHTTHLPCGQPPPRPACGQPDPRQGHRSRRQRSPAAPEAEQDLWTAGAHLTHSPHESSERVPHTDHRERSTPISRSSSVGTTHTSAGCPPRHPALRRTLGRGRRSSRNPSTPNPSTTAARNTGLRSPMPPEGERASRPTPRHTPRTSYGCVHGHVEGEPRVDITPPRLPGCGVGHPRQRPSSPLSRVQCPVDSCADSRSPGRGSRPAQGRRRPEGYP